MRLRLGYLARAWKWLRCVVHKHGAIIAGVVGGYAAPFACKVSAMLH